MLNQVGGKCHDLDRDLSDYDHIELLFPFGNDSKMDEYYASYYDVPDHISHEIQVEIQVYTPKKSIEQLTDHYASLVRIEQDQLIQNYIQKAKQIVDIYLVKQPIIDLINHWNQTIMIVDYANIIRDPNILKVMRSKLSDLDIEPYQNYEHKLRQHDYLLNEWLKQIPNCYFIWVRSSNNFKTSYQFYDSRSVIECDCQARSEKCSKLLGKNELDDNVILYLYVRFKDLGKMLLF